MDISITFISHISHPSHSILSLQGHTDLQEDSSPSWGPAQDMALVTESHVPAQTVFSAR